MAYPTDFVNGNADMGAGAAAYQKVFMSLINSSISIQAESVATANHAMRSAYALRVLADPHGFTKLMLPAYTVGAAVDLVSATDAAVDTRTAAIWNAYAVQG